MKSVGVVQMAVPGFGHDRERPRIAFLSAAAVFQSPGDNGIAHHAHAMRVRDHHRALEKARVLKPGRAGHLAIAIQGKPSAENRILRIFPPGKNGSHPRAHRPDAHLQGPLPEISVV